MFKAVRADGKPAFHGGCAGCDNDLSVCPDCQMFECNWNLPNLNPRHKEHEEMLNKQRKLARSMAGGKKYPILKKLFDSKKNEMTKSDNIIEIDFTDK